jgi:hypothetical protein
MTNLKVFTMPYSEFPPKKPKIGKILACPESGKGKSNS